MDNKTWDNHNIADIANDLFQLEELNELETFCKITPRMVNVILRAAKAYNKTETEAELTEQLISRNLF